MSTRRKFGYAALIIFIVGIIVLAWPTSQVENRSLHAKEGLVGGGLVCFSVFLATIVLVSKFISSFKNRQKLE